MKVGVLRSAYKSITSRDFAFDNEKKTDKMLVVSQSSLRSQRRPSSR